MEVKGLKFEDFIVLWILTLGGNQLDVRPKHRNINKTKREQPMKNGDRRKFAILADMEFCRLTPNLIKQIDEVLNEIDKYGEVRIVVENGNLRYINVLKSDKANDEDRDN